jgi:glycosyltransferase involved in cell wall biosynthesis
MKQKILYYIANARMPNEKAHGIQIAKMCEAFLELGMPLVLVLPRRGIPQQSIKEFYGLRTEVPVITLSAFDVHNKGPFWYYVSSISFMFSYFFYFFFRVDKKSALIYTVDLDHFSYGAIPFLRIPFFSEMHGGKPNTWVHRHLFKNARGIIPTNEITKKQLQETFGVSPERFIVEPNGVDLETFKPLSKADARRELGLLESQKLALYVGRIFDWKGLEILSDAAPLLPQEISLAMVGGTALEFERITKHEAPKAIQFFGSQPYNKIPTWIAAADVLLVLGTKRDEQSYNYTSPMKIFEYMAARRPIVASGTPALKNILSDSSCFFYEPDSAPSLAGTISQATQDPVESDARAARAYAMVTQHTWAKRGERIQSFIQKHAKMDL